MLTEVQNEDSEAQKIQRLVAWIATHSRCESILLTPDPEWTLSAHEMLDACVEIFGLRKAQVSEWVDAAQETKDVRQTVLQLVK